MTVFKAKFLLREWDQNKTIPR
ncbi:cytochrome P450 CYP366A1 precursor, partial [Danaus plexippus plexippus]